MKNLKMMTAVVLLLCIALSLCACVAEPAATTTPNKTQPQTTPNKTEPQTTTKPTEPTSDGKVDYVITVLNPDGTPAANAWIMVCDADKCLIPKETDANGVVVFRLEQKDGYKAKLDGAYEGCQEMADYVYFETGSTTLTIQLVAAE